MQNRVETIERYLRAINAGKPREARQWLAPGCEFVREIPGFLITEDASARDNLGWDAAVERHLVWTVLEDGTEGTRIQGREMNYLLYTFDLPSIEFEMTFEVNRDRLINREIYDVVEHKPLEALGEELRVVLEWARPRRASLRKIACNDEGRVYCNASAGEALCRILVDWRASGMAGDSRVGSRGGQSRQVRTGHGRDPLVGAGTGSIKVTITQSDRGESSGKE